MKYVLAQKNINYCISRGYSIAEVWTKYRYSNITFVKLVPKEESMEIKNCWKAMGFRPLNIEVSLSLFRSKQSILEAAGLYNDLEWNDVYERIIGTAKDNPLGLWKHKPKGLNKKKGEWIARDKNVKQRKWGRFDDLYSVCQRYHLNFQFAEKQLSDKDYYAFNNGVIVKRVYGTT